MVIQADTLRKHELLLLVAQRITGIVDWLFSVALDFAEDSGALGERKSGVAKGLFSHALDV